MSAERKSLAPGILFIVIGALILVDRLDLVDLSWKVIYPLVLLAVGVFFYLTFFSARQNNRVFLATVLSLLGLFFLLRNLDLFDLGFYFYSIEDYWPVFPIVFGAAFIVQFAFSGRDWALLVPGGLLLFVGSVFLAKNLGFFFWHHILESWPVILIVIGTLLILKSLGKI
jgi:hypothetical protein